MKFWSSRRNVYCWNIQKGLNTCLSPAIFYFNSPSLPQGRTGSFISAVAFVLGTPSLSEDFSNLANPGILNRKYGRPYFAWGPVLEACVATKCLKNPWPRYTRDSHWIWIPNPGSLNPLTRWAALLPAPLPRCWGPRGRASCSISPHFSRLELRIFTASPPPLLPSPVPVRLLPWQRNAF